MDMPGDWTMSMMWMRMPGQTWGASTAMFLMMWLAMMVAMMLPSALPMLLNFRRSEAMKGASRPVGSTVLVACGYFTVWMVIGAIAYPIGVAWARATMRIASLSRAVPTLIGASLLLAGVYQFTRWRMAGLSGCRDPRVDGTANHRGSCRVSLSHGFRQGVSCAICCAGPMLVLLALGAMNPVVMIIVTAVITMEKLTPRFEWIARISGLVAVVIGASMVVRTLLVP
jgi:predicted metal-binding membrane protein